EKAEEEEEEDELQLVLVRCVKKESRGSYRAGEELKTSGREPSMSSGLNLTMSTQNSIWSNTPSPLRSPSLTIPISSSSPSPTSPNAATFRLRLSDVITPLSGSISSLNPLHSSSISPSAPSRSAILGRKSWNPIESLAAAMPF
ncbi:unnamed protein product, partial [Musa acuminata var. zebrina]